MVKHVFSINNFFKMGNGGGMSHKLIETELSDYAYPYTIYDAWEWAIEQAAIDVAFDSTENLKSVTITYEGELESD
jgi:hypothetical protein